MSHVVAAGVCVSFFGMAAALVAPSVRAAAYVDAAQPHAIPPDTTEGAIRAAAIPKKDTHTPAATTWLTRVMWPTRT